MGIGAGAIKYMIFVPLSGVGFYCMYIYGGDIITLFNTSSEMFKGNFINAFIEYFVKSALPPTSISHIFENVAAGTVAAGTKWFIAMAARGYKL